jgi:hypothetical protein
MDWFFFVRRVGYFCHCRGQAGLWQNRQMSTLNLMVLATAVVSIALAGLTFIS